LALYYLETSALVKLYIREPGTERLLQLVRSASENRFAVLSLSQVEFRSAIRRRERVGDLDAKIAGLVLDRFQQHMETKFLRQPLAESMLDAACEMVERYALRAYDAVHLAACLALKAVSGPESPTFVCADRQLLQSAMSERLPVLDPSTP
jgi:predicted nucleic acid-binding protein